MVSFILLHRGVAYFANNGINYLPYVKHGMDVYYVGLYSQLPCKFQVFPLVCADDFGSTWSYHTESGCASVLVLLAFIVNVFDTLIAVYQLLYCTKEKRKDYLAGAEDGCCGLFGIMLSIGAMDKEFAEHQAIASVWKRSCHFVSAGFQLAMIVTCCYGVSIVQGPNAFDIQRTSLFVFLPCLMINIGQFIFNMWMSIKDGFEPPAKGIFT